MNILYEKKYSIRTLLYILDNMNCEEALQSHLDEMLNAVDVALEKTKETSLKSRICLQKDVDLALIEEYNNGWIDVRRL